MNIRMFSPESNGALQTGEQTKSERLRSEFKSEDAVSGGVGTNASSTQDVFGLDTVSLSSAAPSAGYGSDAIRWDKVTEAQASISRGTWRVPSEAIAEAILKKGNL